MLNSYVDLLTNGSNADCFCIYSYDIEDESALAADIKNYKLGKAGNEVAAEAYIKNHAIIITDLNGNVEFDLINQLAYSLPNVKAIEIKDNNNINKTIINNYFINYFKFINGQMSKERFEKRIFRMIKG